jgi:hypothetical protein
MQEYNQKKSFRKFPPLQEPDIKDDEGMLIQGEGRVYCLNSVQSNEN